MKEDAKRRRSKDECGSSPVEGSYVWVDIPMWDGWGKKRVDFNLGSGMEG